LGVFGFVSQFVGLDEHSITDVNIWQGNLGGISGIKSGRGVMTGYSHLVLNIGDF
jgi:hypothetical protein